MQINKENAFIEGADTTIKALTPSEKEEMSLDQFIEAFAKYSETLKEYDSYQYGKLLARTIKNKREHYHYYNVFMHIYFLNLLKQLPDDQKSEVINIKNKMVILEKELAKVLKEVKVDDTGMIPYLIGMTEGLL